MAFRAVAAQGNGQAAVAILLLFVLHNLQLASVQSE
jgi:hypothetical protein